MTDGRTSSSVNVNREKWANARCDRYDYMIAAFCGGAAGLVDVFFVGDPLTGALGKTADNAADGLVKKAAHFFWSNDKRTVGKNRQMPESLEQCISYLEQAFPVNYDARYARDLNVADGVLSGMRPASHHLLSLAHSPDPIGLIFSIIDQFTGKASFLDHGKLIRAVPEKTSGAIPFLQGTDLPSMLFCGFVNWIGHLISDISGSSSTRRAGKTGRGAGIPIPFYELFLTCDFGDIDGRTVSETMIRVFEEGFDLRFGAAMAVPVLLEELMIRVIWMIRQKFIRKKSWQESFPSSAHADLRIMLLVGNAAFCMVDGVDAAVHGLMEGGSVVSFICHLNLVGWARLVMLVLKELVIRFGPVAGSALKEFVESVYDILNHTDQERIAGFYRRMEEYDRQLQMLFADFVQQVELEYQQLYLEIKETFHDEKTSAYRAEHSVKLAEISGVSEDRIIRSREQLDDLFS